MYSNVDFDLYQVVFLPRWTCLSCWSSWGALLFLVGLLAVSRGMSCCFLWDCRADPHFAPPTWGTASLFLEELHDIQQMACMVNRDVPQNNLIQTKMDISKKVTFYSALRDRLKMFGQIQSKKFVQNLFERSILIWFGHADRFFQKQSQRNLVKFG